MTSMDEPTRVAVFVAALAFRPHGDRERPAVDDRIATGIEDPPR
jgi:hypothetical protein